MFPAPQDDILSDWATLLKKDQQKLLKKAMEEEATINWEAEKIVRMLKQAPATMTGFEMSTARY